MSWLAINQAPGSCLLTPCRTGERVRRVKARNLLGWDKTNLIGFISTLLSLTGKTKAAYTTKETQGMTSVLPEGRKIFGHLQESTALSHLLVTWDNKYRPFKLSPFFLPSPTSSTDHDVLCSGVSLWSVSVTCPSCVFSPCPMQPRVPHQCSSTKARKGLGSV